MQAYSNPKRETDPYALPDIEVFEQTAAEVAASNAYEDEQHTFMKRPEFKLATMNSRDRDKMIDAMVAELARHNGRLVLVVLLSRLPAGQRSGRAVQDESRSARGCA